MIGMYRPTTVLYSTIRRYISIFSLLFMHLPVDSGTMNPSALLDYVVNLLNSFKFLFFSIHLYNSPVNITVTLLGNYWLSTICCHLEFHIGQACRNLRGASYLHVYWSRGLHISATLTTFWIGFFNFVTHSIKIVICFCHYSFGL